MLKAPSPITSNRNSSDAADSRIRIARGPPGRIRGAAGLPVSPPLRFAPRAACLTTTDTEIQRSRFDQPARDRLDGALDAGRHVELRAGIFNMKIHVSL